MPSERFIPLRVEVLCGFFVSHRGACEYEIRFSWYLISKAAVFLWKSKGGSCVALFRSLQMFLNRINLKFFNHATVVETRHRRTKRMLSNGFFLLEHHAFQCGTTEKSRVSFLNFFFLVYHNLFFFFFFCGPQWTCSPDSKWLFFAEYQVLGLVHWLSSRFGSDADRPPLPKKTSTVHCLSLSKNTFLVLNFKSVLEVARF